jgi:serine/threonine-protein kinase RsbW
MFVLRAGSDLREQIERARRDAVERGALVAHADLSLASPSTAAAASVFRALGFFFAGLLPEYRDGDVLRVQWLSDAVEYPEESVLSTDATRALEKFVLNDRG